MTQKTLTSWGRYPHFPQQAKAIHWHDDVTACLAGVSPSASTLPYGCGRSYGDSCLATSDQVLAMCGLDRILSIDWQTGIIIAEAGLTLAELIQIILPRGWFLPVTPGTKFVTLGGAVANDVHGKNHHVMGTLGRYVRRLTLQRSDLGVLETSPTERSELFAATVGGLGLTGVILTVELQLRRVASSDLEQRSIRFNSLDEFFELAQLHDRHHEYAVAWVDCLASGRQTGRGHYMLAKHAEQGELRVAPAGKRKVLFDPPFSLINAISLKAFNAFYYHRQRVKDVHARVSYEKFFYPLDQVLEWNRIYGRAGFQQYQCVVPQAHSREVIGALLKEIARKGTGSFLAVLKQCGELQSPGLLSFPLHGASLALDFPQHEAVNQRLFKKLDALLHEAGGRLYPAKDAHMSAAHFQQAYPAWSKVEAMRDPVLMSRFWQRVTQSA